MGIVCCQRTYGDLLLIKFTAFGSLLASMLISNSCQIYLSFFLLSKKVYTKLKKLIYCKRVAYDEKRHSEKRKVYKYHEYYLFNILCFHTRNAYVFAYLRTYVYSNQSRKQNVNKKVNVRNFL